MRRSSIATLMGVVLVCGVAVAALRDASDVWAGILLLLTLGWLGTAILGAFYRREGRRAWWVGFALFGWGYLALAFGPWSAEQVGPRLPTTQLLEYLHSKMDSKQEIQLARVWQTDRPVARVWQTDRPVTGYVVDAAALDVVVDAASPNTVPTQATTTRPSYLTQRLAFFLAVSNLEQFRRIGHCLFALLAALIGAGIARRFQATRPGNLEA
ncbi:MAG: hypothetical protein IRY99_25925 [Isosphaeraceae bacterium]|nr:hypothetical protein [Isosphaeraceae bacterium]